MRHNRRLTLLSEDYRLVIKNSLPGWMLRPKFVRSWIVTLSYRLAEQSAKTTANDVKEAYQAGWEEHNKQIEATAKGKRPGMFAMLSSTILYVKSQGWEE